MCLSFWRLVFDDKWRLILVNFRLFYHDFRSFGNLFHEPFLPRWVAIHYNDKVTRNHLAMPFPRMLLFFRVILWYFLDIVQFREKLVWMSQKKKIQTSVQLW